MMHNKIGCCDSMVVEKLCEVYVGLLYYSEDLFIINFINKC